MAPDQHLLPDHDDDHLHPVGHHPDLPLPVALGGSIAFNTPMLFALAFLPMFGIGGLTGLPLASITATFTCPTLLRHRALPLRRGARHDLRIDGRIYFWYPKVTGAAHERVLGQVHFTLRSSS